MYMTMFTNDKTVIAAIRAKLNEPAGKMVTQRMLENYVQKEFPQMNIWKARSVVRTVMTEMGRQVL
jgi:hypothetical protein